jgi:hypothetical protein
MSLHKLRTGQDLLLGRSVAFDVCPESALFDLRWRPSTTYRVEFDSSKLIDACVKALQLHEGVERARIQWVTGEIDIERSGVETSDSVTTETRYVDEVGVAVPDAIGLLQERTGLTRATVAAVLLRSGRAAELRRNPQALIKLVGDVIQEQKHAAMVEGIRYERTGAVWAQSPLRELGEPASASGGISCDPDVRADARIACAPLRHGISPVNLGNRHVACCRHRAFGVSFEEKRRKCRRRSDRQTGVPSRQPFGLPVLTVACTVEVPQLGQTLRDGRQISQHCLNRLSTSGGISHAVRNELQLLHNPPNEGLNIQLVRVINAAFMQDRFAAGLN